MFGDIFGSFATLGVFSPGTNGPGGGTIFDIPGAGGSRRVKIAENNRSLPTDRLIFAYHHFHNAGSFLAGGVTPVLHDFPIDRYTFGVEKTFFDEQWSLEVRLPFTGFSGAGGIGPSGPTAVDGGTFGNLSLILKHVVAESDDGVIAIGLGFDTPTGSDTVATVGANQLAFENQAIHLLPYVGASLLTSESCFVNFFAQLDLALNGNSVELTDFAGARNIGKFNEQNLLYLDLGVGHWFFHDPDAERVTGLAGLVELHYTTSLQDSDAVTAATVPDIFTLSNPINRFDVLNITAGLHLEIAETSMLRVAAVAPLTGNGPDNRFFDAEIQVVFNRRY